MLTEIKRNTWARFCKKFNAGNQLRPATVSVRRRGRDEAAVHDNTPFMGLTLLKNSRQIDAIELFAGHSDPDHLAEPVVTVREPS